MSGTTAEYEAIKQAALTRLPGVDPTLIDLEARWVLHEFLAESRVLTRVFILPMLPALTEYSLLTAGLVPLDEATESAVVALEALYDGTPLTLGRAPLDTLTTGAPRVIGLLDDRTAVVFPTPTDAELGKEVTLRVALTLLPNNVALVMPDAVRPYHSYILDGLLARLLFMPDKPWTNTRMADPHMRRFQAGKTFARRGQDAGRSYGSLRMRGPRFGV